MNLSERLADYSAKHADPSNLAIHAAAVPLALLAALTSLAALSFPVAAALALSLAVLWCVTDLRAGLPAAAGLLLLLACAHAAVDAGGALLPGLLGLALLPASIGIQGLGHRRERVQVRFRGPVDFLVILGREQCYLAPLFLAGRALGLLRSPSPVH